jgi:hypothetical protein
MTPVATLRARARRLEEIDRQRDPNSWTSPSVEGEVEFEFEKAPNNAYRLGYGTFRFTLEVTACEFNSVYVYKDKIHAVGLNRSLAEEHSELAAQLTPGRSVTARVGDEVILQNSEGVLCLVKILGVQQEQSVPTYVPASVRFHYRILTSS